MTLAPIILFTYKRPHLTQQVLEALQNNTLAPESTLYIFCDGPKNNATPIELEKIAQTRAIVKSKKWCKEVIIIERDKNYGLQRSIIEGVTEIINKYGRVIVLEDDIVTSKYFLQFMNDALIMYEHEQKVLSIGAFNFFATDAEVNDTFFIPIPDCWGWATWKNRWQLFEPNAQKLLNKLREKGLINKFNLYGAYDFENMLIDQIKGNISSWAIRWQALAYIEDKLSLYPKYSVTTNIGFDGEGTHSGGEDRFTKNIKFTNDNIKLEKLQPQVDPDILKKMMNGYANIWAPTRVQKIRSNIKKLLIQLLPPILIQLYKKNNTSKNNLLWQGIYLSWNDAKQNSIGYDDSLILEKTKNATLKVINNEAAFERDTILFERAEFNWPVLTILLKAAGENNQKLSVLDFGGALGSTYFQNRSFLQSTSLEWSVVEQSHYIQTGNEFIADECLKFYSTINSCMQNRKPNVLLLSGVLQYLEHPYTLMEEVINYGFDYIIVDKTTFIDNNNAENGIEILTVQNVPAYIYPASYPVWLFDVSKFLPSFTSKYKMISDFEPYRGTIISLEGNVSGNYKGFVFQKLNSHDF